MGIEEQTAEERQANRQAFYKCVSDNFPEGLVGAQNGVPVTIDGYNLHAILFGTYRDGITAQVGLFKGIQRYSRMTLCVSEMGEVSVDTRGIIPAFDNTDDEPTFVSPVEDIADVVIAAVTEDMTRRLGTG